MAYQAEISRKNPGCFLFLVDQSESMEDPFGGGEAGRQKAEELATILNKLIHNLCIRCAKCNVGLMAILLGLGVMDLRAMAVVARA